MSPTQRSLAKLRAEGWHCEVTEHWNPWTKQRKDLFGFIDILALKGDMTLGVQTTTDGHICAREDKLKALQSLGIWQESANRMIVIHGWGKHGPRGKRKTWQCKEIWL